MSEKEKDKSKKKKIKDKAVKYNKEEKNAAEDGAESAKKEKRVKLRVSIRVFFTLLIIAEIIVGIAIALLILSELSKLLPVSIRLHPAIILLSLSAIVGIISASYINQRIFSPIRKISQSMAKVADGDFSVRLETESRITEIQEIYNSFNLMARELSANETIGSDFVSNVSHEFKTPINAIEGYATLLQNEDDASPELRAQYTEKILYSTRRLSDLASNVLLISKIENQAIDTKKAKTRLDEQIRQAILLLEPKWTDKEIDFDVDLDTVEYVCNGSLMLHVFTNLIDNAIKFDPQGGYVGVKMRERGGEIVITVEDDGPGVPDSAKRRIFDKFYQSDSSHKDEGSGLGLALVRRIVSACGGTVSVSDREPHGAVFTVTLKRSDEE